MEYMCILLFLAGILFCLAMNLSVLWGMILGFFYFLSVFKTHSWFEPLKKVLSGVLDVKTIFISFLLTGILSGLWRSSGTIVVLICYTLPVISPETSLMMAFLLNCLISYLTGSAFGSALTMGVISFSVCTSLNVSPVLAGKAVISGIFFGDRCSPVSTSALLVSQITHTNLYENMKAMIKNAWLPFVLTCPLYLLLGLLVPASGSQTCFSIKVSWRFCRRPCLAILFCNSPAEIVPEYQAAVQILWWKRYRCAVLPAACRQFLPSPFPDSFAGTAGAKHIPETFFLHR